MPGWLAVPRGWLDSIGEISRFCAMVAGQVYSVRPYNAAGEGSPSNSVTISGCSGLVQPPDFLFTRTGYSPCRGVFTWGSVPEAVAYRVYRNGSQVGDVTGLQFPVAPGEFNVADGEVYEVKAYDDGGHEGPAASLIIDAILVLVGKGHRLGGLLVLDAHDLKFHVGFLRGLCACSALEPGAVRLGII